MALQFNPPEWLIKDYLSRKSPVEELAGTLDNISSNYLKDQQQKKIQAQALALQQHTNAREDFNATKDLLPEDQIAGAAKAAGLSMGPMGSVPPPTVSSGTVTPVEMAGQQSMPTEHPGDSGNPLIQASIQAHNWNPLDHPVPTSKAGLAKYRTNLDMQNTQQLMDERSHKNDPVPVITKEKAIAEGTVNPNAKILEPASDRNSTRQDALDERIRKDITTYAQLVESHPVIKKLNEQQIGIDQVNDLAHLVNDGNTVASSAMGTKMAKAMGEVGALTENDVRRYVQSGKLTQSSGDKLNRMINGKPSEATMQEISQITGVLKDTYGQRVQPIYNRYIERFARNYHMSNQEAAYKLNFPYQPAGVGGSVSSPKQGTSEVVRQTKDGKKAVFDSTTKQFLRYEE